MIDWKTFSARVPAGTMVRSIEPNHEWRAFLLENYPFEQEERLSGDIDSEKVHELRMQRAEVYPSLRIQDFEIADVERISPEWNFLEYMIDGQWLKFDQVMISMGRP